MKNVLVLFGGQSSEHDVSCVSAMTVMDAIDTTRYEVTAVGITKDGRWKYIEDIDALKNQEKNHWEESLVEAYLLPVDGDNLMIKDPVSVRYKHVDVAFPVLHGLYGEDGRLQGMFEMLHIPYVGCGHLSGAVTMDKFFTKIIADSAGVAQAAYTPVRAYELKDIEAVMDRVESERDYPVFIKPSNAGSSVGITKAHNRDELKTGLLLAADNDSKILVEETITGREIECAVYGYGEGAVAAGIGEVVAAAEFYDFDAKYNNAESRTVINPELPVGKAEELKEAALKIYRACDCFGLSRVDFFLEEGTDRVVFNEINTIPGHTSISMYPMIMESAGYRLTDYLSGLIEMADERKCL